MARIVKLTSDHSFHIWPYTKDMQAFSDLKPISFTSFHASVVRKFILRMRLQLDCWFLASCSVPMDTSSEMNFNNNTEDG